MSPDLYEKLGQFYLGREVTPEGKTTDDLVLYDSSNLTTHGVCVGMTGSGKTGLCIALLEEAAMDGIPALMIDPKGDLGNLLLTFPQMRGEDFAPWVSEEDARKAGVTTEEFGAKEAEKAVAGEKVAAPLVLDCADLSYLSSAGVRFLLGVQKAAAESGSAFALASVRPTLATCGWQ